MEPRSLRREPSIFKNIEEWVCPLCVLLNFLVMVEVARGSLPNARCTPESFGCPGRHIQQGPPNSDSLSSSDLPEVNQSKVLRTCFCLVPTCPSSQTIGGNQIKCACKSRPINLESSSAEHGHTLKDDVQRPDPNCEEMKHCCCA